MKKSLFPFFLIILTSQALCQTPISYEFDKLWEEFRFVKFVNGEYLTNESNYKGTPYMEVDDKSCTLVLENSQSLKGLTIRYNIYNDQMEIEREGIYYIIPKQKEFSSFKLDNHLFKYLIYTDNGATTTGNLEVLIEGTCSLYRKYRITLLDPQPARPYHDPKPATFKSKAPEFFFAVGDDQIVKLTSSKDFIELLPEHQDKIAQFIKKNKLKFRKQEDIVKVVEYFNSL